MGDAYQAELGERLRRIRNQQGLTLHDVESRSRGEWKAVVIGSYERGDRAISVPKLARLAEFYGVPVSELLPGDASTDDDGAGPTRVVIDLSGLDPDAQGPLGAVARYARTVQLNRGDFNGRVLTIRTVDVEAIAAASGLTPTDLMAVLDEGGALLRA